MPRDAVSRTANVERNGGHKWVNAMSKHLLGTRSGVSISYRLFLYCNLVNIPVYYGENIIHRFFGLTVSVTTFSPWHETGFCLKL